MARRPAPVEYPEWFERYVRLVEDIDDIGETLARQIDETMTCYRGITDAQTLFRYAPDKWSVKEVLGHLADTERVLQYRALGVARGDQTSFPSFEENEYVKTARSEARPWANILDDFKAVRASSVALFRGLDEEALDRIGRVNQKPMSARALGFIIIGHERHHLAILKDKYLQA